MNEELSILRAMSSKGSELSFAEAQKLYEERMQKLEAEASERNAMLMAEYHTIINTTPDLEKRKQKLTEQIRKLGFNTLWHQSDSLHRTHSYPPKKIEEKIWYNASQEIQKIDLILTARSEKRLDAEQ